MSSTRAVEEPIAARGLLMCEMMPVTGQPWVFEVGGSHAWSQGLRQRGFVIDRVDESSTALQWLTGSPHTVAIVQRTLRDNSCGIHLAHALRKSKPKLGIVLLGPAWDPVERRKLMEEFADACLTEGTDVDDVAAVLIALDRRAVGAAIASCSMSWGSLRLDFMTGSMAIDGKEIALQPLQMRILACLIQHSGTVVTRDDLQRKVFRATRVSGTSIPRQISVLRRHLAPFGAEIQTVSGGYGMGISEAPPRR